MDQTQIPIPQPVRNRLRQRHLIAMPHWLVRGMWEMVQARRTLYRIKPGDIPSLNWAANAQAQQSTHPEAIERVAFILALLGRILPWRSDCLVQALAGQRWLARLGIASTIHIGARTPSPGELAAHAWLVVSDQVITGGNVDDYSVLIGDTVDAPARADQS